MVPPQSKGPGRRPARRPRRLRPALDLLEPRVAPASGLAADLPIAARYAVSEAVGRSGAEYAATAEGGSIVLANPDNGYEASVAAEGFRIASGADSWSFALRGIGYGGSVRPLGAATVSTDANRVEYDHGAVTQWFVNGPLGLQQGFTLDARPEGSEAGGPLTILLGVDGVVASADPGGTSVSLARPDGAPVASYGGLVAHDAAGRSIPAAMIVDAEGAALAILVDDAEAVYPLVVDPYVQSSWFSAGGSAIDRLPIEISADGRTLAIARAYLGGVMIFESRGASWTSTATLSPSMDFEARFGMSGTALSMSADGRTVAINVAGEARNTQGPRYLVCVFTLTVEGWSSGQLLSLPEQPDAYFGSAVATNGDGRVLGVTTWNHSLSIYNRVGDEWELADRLPAPDPYAYAQYGGEMAFDDAGENLVVGSPATMSAYFYKADGDHWSEAGVARMPEGAPTYYFGSSAAMSGDGSTALVGGAFESLFPRRFAPIQVFSRSGDGIWTRTGELAVETDPATMEGLGGPIAINDDGTVAAATVTRWDSARDASDAVHVFRRTINGWVQEGKIDPAEEPNSSAEDEFGLGLALRGNLLVIGSRRRFPSSPNTSLIITTYPIVLVPGPNLDTGPFIQSNPANHRALPGRTTTFTASAFTTADGPPTYSARWEVSRDGGTTWTAVEGPTSSVAVGSTLHTWLTLEPTPGDSGKLFRAVFTNPETGKELAAEPATLTIFEAGVSITAELGMNPRPLGVPMTVNVRVASLDALAAPYEGGLVRLIVGGITLEGTLRGGVTTFSIPETLEVGAHTLNVEYIPADGGAMTSQFIPDRLLVSRAWSSLALETPREAAFGDATTLTAVLDRSAAWAAAIGGVVLMDGGRPIAFEQVSTAGGRVVATFSTAGLAVGDHYFQLVYLGSPTTSAVSSGVYKLTIKPPGSAVDRGPASLLPGTQPGKVLPSGIARTPTPAVPHESEILRVVQGEALTLTADLSGEYRSVRWQFGQVGGPWTDYPGQTDPWFTATFKAPRSAWTIRALFVDAQGEEVVGAMYTVQVVPRPVRFILDPIQPASLGSRRFYSVQVATADPEEMLDGWIRAYTPRASDREKLEDGRAKVSLPADQGSELASTLWLAYEDSVAPSSPTSTAFTLPYRKREVVITVTAPEWVAPGSGLAIRVQVEAAGDRTRRPTGGVMFLDNGRPIALIPIDPAFPHGNAAVLSTNLLPPGEHYLQMVYLGDPYTNLASSGVFRVTVSTVAPASLKSTPAPSAAASPQAAPQVSILPVAPAFIAAAVPPAPGPSPSSAVAATAAPHSSSVPAAPIRPRVVDPAAGPVGARKWGLLEGGSSGEG